MILKTKFIAIFRVMKRVIPYFCDVINLCFAVYDLLRSSREILPRIPPIIAVFWIHLNLQNILSLCSLSICIIYCFLDLKMKQILSFSFSKYLLPFLHFERQKVTLVYSTWKRAAIMIDATLKIIFLFTSFSLKSKNGIYLTAFLIILMLLTRFFDWEIILQGKWWSLNV